MQKIDLVVTRHKGLVAYLLNEGIITGDVEVIPHASPEAIKGKHVLGVLPVNLAALCASFTEVPLALPQELRGNELTEEQVRKYASAPVTYKISKL